MLSKPIQKGVAHRNAPIRAAVEYPRPKSPRAKT